jgi:hypothetical protein
MKSVEDVADEISAKFMDPISPSGIALSATIARAIREASSIGNYEDGFRDGHACCAKHADNLRARIINKDEQLRVAIEALETYAKPLVISLHNEDKIFIESESFEFRRKAIDTINWLKSRMSKEG